MWRTCIWGITILWFHDIFARYAEASVVPNLSYPEKILRGPKVLYLLRRRKHAPWNSLCLLKGILLDVLKFKGSYKAKNFPERFIIDTQS